MRATTSMLVAGTALVTSATATTILVARLVEQRDESCGVPPGVTDPVVAQHAMACRDLEHGRITLVEYRRMIGLDAPPSPPAPHIQ